MAAGGVEESTGSLWISECAATLRGHPPLVPFRPRSQSPVGVRADCRPNPGFWDNLMIRKTFGWMFPSSEHEVTTAKIVISRNENVPASEGPWALSEPFGALTMVRLGGSALWARGGILSFRGGRTLRVGATPRGWTSTPIPTGG